MSENPSVATLSVFPMTAAANPNGHLVIGGCDVVELAHAYGTPLYVFDEATLRQQCRSHCAAFSSRYHDAKVLYAGKAYLGLKLAHLIAEEGLGLDVVSGGELFVARAAGFDPARICFHGNNKSADELALAFDWGVGRIVVDNLHELALLERLAEERAVDAATLLRLAPAVDPHTHKYIATGVADSKFGLPIATGMAARAVARALAAPRLRLCGFHAHIGSQIHDLAAYEQTVGVLVAFAADMHAKHGFVAQEMSLGGGWAVRYLPDEVEPSPDEVATVLVGALRRACERHELPLPALSVEPGRAIVARAGVALYTAGGTKDIADVRRYVFVDGGMADNIRPALYGARYTAVVANRLLEPADGVVTIAGRYCESGDILIDGAALPRVQPGDIVALATCGAYAPALASNYNMSLRPAIVAVHDGHVTLWRRRETYDDLVRCEAGA